MYARRIPRHMAGRGGVGSLCRLVKLSEVQSGKISVKEESHLEKYLIRTVLEFSFQDRELNSFLGRATGTT